MQVEQRIECVGRVIVELQARRAFVVAAEAVVAAGCGVVDPVVAMLAQDREARRPVVAERATDGALEVRVAIGAVAHVEVAFGFVRRLLRIELDHAGRRVAAEQRALRAAQHFDLVDVEDREAFENRVFEHDVVVDERHGLRCVQVEIGVAEAADVEARKRAPERRFDQQARHAARQELHVVAAGLDDVEFLGVDRRDRLGHLLHVLDAFLGGHGDLAERLRCRRVVGCGLGGQREARHAGKQRATDGEGGGEGFARGADVAVASRGHCRSLLKVVDARSPLFPSPRCVPRLFFFFVFPSARAMSATALFTNANFCRFSTRDVKILQRITWHQNGAAIYCGFITARWTFSARPVHPKAVVLQLLDLRFRLEFRQLERLVRQLAIG